MAGASSGSRVDQRPGGLGVPGRGVLDVQHGVQVEIVPVVGRHAQPLQPARHQRRRGPAPSARSRPSRPPSGRRSAGCGQPGHGVGQRQRLPDRRLHARLQAELVGEQPPASGRACPSGCRGPSRPSSCGRAPAWRAAAAAPGSPRSGRRTRPRPRPPGSGTSASRPWSPARPARGTADRPGRARCGPAPRTRRRSRPGRAAPRPRARRPAARSRSSQRALLDRRPRHWSCNVGLPVRRAAGRA